MDFIDVVFPLKIGPLTYRIPQALSSRIVPGMVVRAEVKRSQTQGIVLNRTERPPEGRIKEIAGLLSDKPVFSLSLIKLLKWMSGYYLVPEGLVLKHMLPMDIFKAGTRGKKQKKQDDKSNPVPSAHNLTPSLSRETISILKDSASAGQYKAYLLHPPTQACELSDLLEIIKDLRNVIVLTPERTHLDMAECFLRDIFGERLAVIHGRLTSAQKQDVFNRIISGFSDIVLGTRPAVFAPLHSVSLIAVIQEQNRSYKNLEGIRYHARDVAVMRAYMEKSAVVLSSSTPSIDSFYNTIKGKYTLITPDISIPRPRIEVVNMKTAKKITPYLSKRTADMAGSCVRKNEGVLFLINRKGYSMIQCSDCGHIETCPVCNSPFIYHKNSRMLRCSRCGQAVQPEDTCSRCKGARLDAAGAGTQRIEADLQKYLGVKPLRIDKDILRESPEMKGFADILTGDEIIVGTRLVTERLRGRNNYSLCIFLNPDIKLHFPDFRSSELLFQEIASLVENVKNGGAVIVQTRMPENGVYRYIRKYNFPEFFTKELSNRKALSYPPFSRIILIKMSAEQDAEKMITEALPTPEERIEVIGPLPDTGQKVKGPEFRWKLILKSEAKERLHAYAKRFLENIKDIKQINAVADVDPVSL